MTNHGVKISFFGDFVSLNPHKLKIGANLKEMLILSDFNIVNFEAPIATEDAAPIHKSGPNICQSCDAPKWLESNGFNIISLANNHMLDFGIKAAKATKDAFESAHTVGLGTSDDAYRSLTVEKQGLRIAILALTHREFSCCEDYGYGCAWMCSTKVQKEILSIRASVDILFIVNHGGLEYFNQPLPEYRNLYRHWIELGADAVIASHPHVPQGWEEFNGKPIFYSLGNLCFEKSDGTYPDMWNSSLMVTFNLSKGELQYGVNNISYNTQSNVIDIENDTAIASSIQALNTTLIDDNKYNCDIQEHMQHLVPLYEYMLNVGKYTKIGFNMPFLKSMARIVLRRPTDAIHHLNLYRCETHRWVMEHLLSNNLL